MIVHYGKLNMPPPKEQEGAVALFDWLPDEVARENSPQIVRADSCSDLVALIDAAWDQDALVCLYSNADWEELVSHLRQALHFNSQGLPQQGRSAHVGILLARRAGTIVGVS